MSGLSFRREPEKDKKIVQKVWAKLQETHLVPMDRCRLIILSICFLELRKEDTSKFMKALKEIKNLGDVALNLSKICGKAMRKYSLSPNLFKAK